MHKYMIYPVIFFFICSFSAPSQTEEFYTKEKIEGNYKTVSFSGFRVELIPSDNFHITFNNDDILKKLSIQEDQLHIMIMDQTGQVPKETIQVYINDNIDSISIHNGELTMEEFLIKDVLGVNFAVTSGTLKVHTHTLYVTAGGGIDCEIEGTAKYFHGHEGGRSKINHENLVSEKKTINRTRYF